MARTDVSMEQKREMCVESCRSIIRVLTACKEHVITAGTSGMKTREQTRRSEILKSAGLEFLKSMLVSILSGGYLSRDVQIKTGDDKVTREEEQAKLADYMKEAVSHLQTMVDFIEREDRWVASFYKNLLALDEGKKNVEKTVLDTTEEMNLFARTSVKEYLKNFSKCREDNERLQKEISAILMK